MKKTVLLTVLLVVVFANQAHAFIFTDIIAEVQRAQMIAQEVESVAQMASYRNEFNTYMGVFAKYFNTFHLIYKRLSAEDWKDFTPSNWTRLKDHFITFWQTFDEGAWQTQVVALKVSPMYARNPDYRQYSDSLISLSENQVTQLKQEEAHLIDLQSQDALHNDDLERFKARNAELALGDDEVGQEIALSQQVALTNAILIEMASIQAETKVVEERLLTDQKEERNLIMRMKQLEIEAQKGDLMNLNQFVTLTKTK